MDVTYGFHIGPKLHNWFPKIQGTMELQGLTIDSLPLDGCETYKYCLNFYF